MFSCEFYEVFKNTFFTEHVQITASESDNVTFLLQKGNGQTRRRSF